MRSAAVLALLAALLSWPAAARSEPPLPLAPATSGDAAIDAALAGLMEDYAKAFPARRDLYDDSSESASPRSTFFKTCATAAAACEKALGAQFDILATEFRARRAARADVGMRDALIATALSDICTLRIMASDDRCFAQVDMAAIAAIAWQGLGQDYLFLAYQGRESSQRAYWRRLTESNDQLTQEQKARHLKKFDPDKRAHERSAYANELADSNLSAMSAWSQVWSAAAPGDHETRVTTAANMARLNAAQDRGDAARYWWGVADELVKQHPEVAKSGYCTLASERFQMDVEMARGAQLPMVPEKRFHELVEKECPFTRPAISYALLALSRQDLAGADRVLDLAQKQCMRRQKCGSTRREHIAALRAVAKGTPAQLKKQSAYWQDRLKTGTMLATDRRIVWALADRLHRSGGAAEELYAALDTSIDNLRNFGGAHFFNVSVYDGLKRMLIRLKVESGQQVAPHYSENLRSQLLTRRLQAQRWLSEASDVGQFDEKAAAEKALAESRKVLQQLQVEKKKAQPQDGALFDALIQDVTMMEQALMANYVGMLQSRKHGLSIIAGINYNASEQDVMFSDPLLALGQENAYLSWVRVPGGFVATLVAKSADYTRQTLGISRLSLWNRFVPFDATDEKILQLYRDLLQAGTHSSRGAQVTARSERAPTALLLDGKPLWSMTDGRIVPAPTAPPGGATRIVHQEDLSKALYRRLLLPFEPNFKHAKQLIISPDGPLAYLPFETLSNDGKQLVQTFDVSYVQSLAVYSELKKRSASKGRTGKARMLSVADPDYGDPGAVDTRGQRGFPGGLSWLALPGTRRESAALATIYPDNVQLLGKRASAGAIGAMAQEGKLAGFQLLHFATHGYVDDQRSALVLAADDAGPPAYLLDQEIASWRINSDLVLLSACNTGIGRQQAGEGIVGLPFAFFMAGNINTLMSLWPVEDAGTAIFIPEFMKRVEQGQDHVAALNSTKRAFADGSFGPRLSNPRIWSAFVLYGVPLAPRGAEGELKLGARP